MANGLQLNDSTVIGGLGTQSFTVVIAGIYTVQFNISIPYLAAGSSSNSATAAPSALSVVVNQNGSAKLTSSAPSANQPFVCGSVNMLCAAADVVTVVLSSSNAADNLPNAIKGVINLYQGE